MLINVFGEIINPDNITYLKEVIERDNGYKLETRIYFTSSDESKLGSLCRGQALFACVEVKDKTKLDVMEEINRQIKENK